jgi:dCMP deaminase
MMSVSNRPTWEEYAMQLAKVAAKRSEDVYQQVGACALDHDHRVIGVAYNGLAPGKNVDPVFWTDRDRRRPFVLHAETNLLSLIRRGECKIIACTLMPCAACATSIAAHGVEQVVYDQVYQRDTRALEIFDFYGISCKQLTSRTTDI